MTSPSRRINDSICEFELFIILDNKVWTVTVKKKKSHWISHHGVRLPRAGLPVGEDAGVVALERSLQHVGAQIFKNLQIKQTHTEKKELLFLLRRL